MSWKNTNSWKFVYVPAKQNYIFLQFDEFLYFKLKYEMSWKIHESLLTFRLSSADLPSIWQIFWQKIIISTSYFRLQTNRSAWTSQLHWLKITNNLWSSMFLSLPFQMQQDLMDTKSLSCLLKIVQLKKKNQQNFHLLDQEMSKSVWSILMPKKPLQCDKIAYNFNALTVIINVWLLYWCRFIANP